MPDKIPMVGRKHSPSPWIRSTAMQNNPYAHRKQKAVVRLLRDGKPVPNADIRLAMKRHAFLFGCGAFEQEIILRI